MRKQWLLVSLAFLGVGSFGVYYFWKQATAVPEWYVQSDVQSSDEKIRENSFQPEVISQKLPELNTESFQEDKKVSSTALDEEVKTVRLSSEEMEQLMNNRLIENHRTKPFWEASEGVQVRVNSDRIEMGTVINPSSISPDALGASEQVIFERAMGSFPRLGQQAVYVGITGNFDVDSKGEVSWDEDTKVRVGNLEFSLKEVSQRLGISSEQLKEQLQLHFQYLEVNRVFLQDEEVVFEGE